MSEINTGILLVNLGTPASPSSADVGSYLREFLMDGYVIDIPWLFRAVLVHLLIVPRRSHQSAKLYQKIWTGRGSPLKFHTEDFTLGVSELLNRKSISASAQFCMRYGTPTIAETLSKMGAKKRLIVCPLYPQEAEASTISCIEKVKYYLNKHPGQFQKVDYLPAFYNAPEFTRSFARRFEEKKPSFDHLLFSFHGLPERQVKRASSTCFQSAQCCAQITEKNKHCYRAQSFETARLIAGQIGLAPEKYTVCFQSRLGRTPWISPYTDYVIPELAKKGFKKLAVFCPSFVSDCLETLEEVQIRNRELFLEHGGEELTLIPSLNAQPDWIEGFVELLQRYLQL